LQEIQIRFLDRDGINVPSLQTDKEVM
jgi:hypothetical protein